MGPIGVSLPVATSRVNSSTQVEAWKRVGDDRAVQGNLDPVVFLSDRKTALQKAREIRDRVGGRPGHIFNCGHGLVPGTDPEVVRAVVDLVHEYSA